MNKYCYNGLLWLAQGEDVNIYDDESGDLLVEDFTLSERKDTIKLPLPYDYYVGTFNTGAKNSIHTIDCGFEPKVFFIASTYPAFVSRWIEVSDAAEYIGGSSAGVNSTDLTSFDLSVSGNEITFKTATDGWSNRDVVVVAVPKINGQFTSPANGQSIHIDCGFRPGNVILQHNIYLILDGYISEVQSPYIVSSNQALESASGSSNNSIISLDDGGFTYKTLSNNRAGKTVTWFATPDTKKHIKFKSVFSHLQRGRSDGDQTFTAPKTGQYILYNEYIDNSGAYSSPNVTSAFTTSKSPVCQVYTKNSRVQGGNIRTYDIEIAVYNLEAGDQVVFTNSESNVGLQYTTQTHMAFLVTNGSILNIEAISGGSNENKIMQDSARGTSYTRPSIPPGDYFAVAIESHGYTDGTADTNMVINGIALSQEKHFEDNIFGPHVFASALFESTGSIDFTWSGITTYVGRGYLLLKLTIDES